MKKFAVRNIRLCTKDCLCLYVCPTGATDTENSVIDREKCVGCGVCAQACPSGAIHLVPAELPPQQPKSEEITGLLRAFAHRKSREEAAARSLGVSAEQPGLRKLMAAAERSLRLTEEDVLREAGFMLPQCAEMRRLLRALAEDPPAPDFPVQAAWYLLGLLPEEEAPEGRSYRCSRCGKVFQVPEGEEARCPVCGAGEDELALLED